MPKVVSILMLVLLIAASAFGAGQSEAQDEEVTIQVAYPVAVDAPITDRKSVV